MQTLVLFPHQLYFDLSELPKDLKTIYLVEEYLFFRQYKFHKQKLVFHRASMKAYAEQLEKEGYEVKYIDAHDNAADARNLIAYLKNQSISALLCFDPDDFWLKKRLVDAAANENIYISFENNQLFINTSDDLANYKAQSKKLFQTDFYVYQRKIRGILLDDLGGPLGGKWSYDADNRKKYPNKKVAPPLPACETSSHWMEAQDYVSEHFPNNLGNLDGPLIYPITPKDAFDWLQQFFEERFHEFGMYEDAIVDDQSILNHAVITPMLNVGILKPLEVIQSAIVYAEKNDIELNNVEGFVRQILGWREFVRYVYLSHGVAQRTKNFWGFNRKIPASFYEGSTGIKPVDDAIRKVHNTAYNHHIERLMVISNFMLLCEFDPDEVYQWFMEYYIDAYDWVNVPNVYCKAQFEDGGMMCTKPYISGSNYIFKMSNYKKGEPWAEVWDALFWRFMSVNRDFFKRNPRLSMLISTFDKWDANKRTLYLERAERFLEHSEN
jgi:deoxyribodipyrimidine photolyase-related protein